MQTWLVGSPNRLHMWGTILFRVKPWAPYLKQRENNRIATDLMHDGGQGSQKIHLHLCTRANNAYAVNGTLVSTRHRATIQCTV